MIELIEIVKNIVVFLFYTFIGSILLWFISHIFMATVKTLFCDYQIKLYKEWIKEIKSKSRKKF